MRTTLFVICALAAYGQQYDLLLKGGHVVDPKNNVNAVRDVAIKGDRVAAVAADIPAAQAAKVIDLAGLYVTPGLVDIHAHVWSGTRGSTTNGGLNSVFPDHLSFRTG